MDDVAVECANDSSVRAQSIADEQEDEVDGVQAESQVRAPDDAIMSCIAAAIVDKYCL